LLPLFIPLYRRYVFQNFLFGLGFLRVFTGDLKMMDSRQLLADYARNGSEEAFRELVTRYLALVYSTAIRLVGGDSHLAEDVAQTVFVDLPRKARTLPGDVMLGGWLHRDTCFVAAKTVRSERRRESRERYSVEMNTWQDHSGSDLMQVAPILDEAIAKPSPKSPPASSNEGGISTSRCSPPSPPLRFPNDRTDANSAAKNAVQRLIPL
jgi:DNA-directed RNA polymerase specialized sigma24 family protein